MDECELAAIVERERERHEQRAARAAARGGAFDQILERWVPFGRRPLARPPGPPPVHAAPSAFCCLVISTPEV